MQMQFKIDVGRESSPTVQTKKRVFSGVNQEMMFQPNRNLECHFTLGAYLT